MADESSCQDSNSRPEHAHQPLLVTFQTLKSSSISLKSILTYALLLLTVVGVCGYCYYAGMAHADKRCDRACNLYWMKEGCADYLRSTAAAAATESRIPGFEKDGA